MSSPTLYQPGRRNQEEKEQHHKDDTRNTSRDKEHHLDSQNSSISGRSPTPHTLLHGALAVCGLLGGTNALYEECDTLVGPQQIAATHLFSRVQATILNPSNRRREVIEMKVGQRNVWSSNLPRIIR